MATKRKVNDSPGSSPKKKKSSGHEGEKLRFLMVGKTGDGKSSTGNTILGQPVFTTDLSFCSVTSQCELRSAVRFGTTIDVMDCPGFFDSHSSDTDVAAAILEALTSMDPGPDVIGYVIQIGRYTEEDFSAYRHLKALMDDVTDHMVVILTHGDRLQGQNVWEKLNQAPRHLQTVVKECGHRVVVFDNTCTRAKNSQVKAFLKEARKLQSQNQHAPYSLELKDDTDTEAEQRMLCVEKTETRRKAFVKKLQRKKVAANEALLAERRNQSRRQEEHEESFNRMEETMENKKRALSARLRKQKKMIQGIKEQLDSLEEQLDEFVPRRKKKECLLM